MPRKIQLRKAARLDIREAAASYEAKQPGFGKRFLAELNETLKRVARMPELYGIHVKDVRRAGTHVFPYSIYYRLRPLTILVLCVFHDHRDPGTIMARIEDD